MQIKLGAVVTANYLSAIREADFTTDRFVGRPNAGAIDMLKGSSLKSVGIFVVTAPLLLAACASQDDVRRAQATADQALAAAQQANQAAQAASQKADKAEADAAAASAKADSMFQQSLKK
jgi:Alanine-zipper, major outer membrane lipoprotein